MKNRFIFIFVFVTFSLFGNSLAYIDPGTGITIASSIWTTVAMFLTAIVAFFVKKFFNPIKKFFIKIWQMKEKN